MCRWALLLYTAYTANRSLRLQVTLKQPVFEILLILLLIVINTGTYFAGTIFSLDVTHRCFALLRPLVDLVRICQECVDCRGRNPDDVRKERRIKLEKAVNIKNTMLSKFVIILWIVAEWPQAV